jgi:very-short-patch-repair endonuclease
MSTFDARDPLLSWSEVAASQDGVLSRRQALLGGLSEDAWQWRLDTGRWRALLPGVAVTHSGEATGRQCAWAAALGAGTGAALTADAALVEHGMRLPVPSVLHVAVPHTRTVVARPLPAAGEGGRVVPHRVCHLLQWVHPVRRPPLVRFAPALLHAAAWAESDRAAEWRVAAAVQQRLVRPVDVRRELVGMPGLRRAGLLRTVLDDVELGAHAASELDFLRFLRRHGLPRPDRLQRLVRYGTIAYLDAWWERQRVAAEIDGAHHRFAGTWDADVLRANEVVVAERHARVLLLRFTTGNLRHDGAQVAGQLGRALT